jgi:hypothetical protein
MVYVVSESGWQAGARVVARFMDVVVVAVLVFGGVRVWFTVTFGLASEFAWGFVFGFAYRWCSWSHLG